MGHHTSNSKQPLSAMAKVLLFGGAALIGVYGWYTESAKNRPQPVVGATTDTNLSGASGTLNSNPWDSPSPPPFSI